MTDAVTDMIDLAEIWRKRMRRPDGGVFTYLIESDRLAYRLPIGDGWDFHQWTIPPGTLSRIRYEMEHEEDAQPSAPTDVTPA